MNASHVAFGALYQGAMPPEGDELRRQGFHVLVLCAEGHQPDGKLFPGVRVIHAPFDDHPIDKGELRTALDASKEVAAALLRGRKVLVTCQMGLNRSGLVTGLALRRLGISPTRAIWLIRKARGEWALSNESFVDTLFGVHVAPTFRRRMT